MYYTNALQHIVVSVYLSFNAPFFVVAIFVLLCLIHAFPFSSTSSSPSWIQALYAQELQL